MPFSAMIKLKLKFFKSMQNKITNSIFYFSFILDYMTQKQFNSEKKEKEEKKEGRKKKREKEN